MLLAPELYVEAIRRACDPSIGGWAAAARTILIAMPATRLGVPENMRQQLTEIAARTE
jgi:hypothetical protein